MTKTYQTGPAGARAAGVPLVPESATIALAEIAESAKEGLVALAAGRVCRMQAVMEESVLELDAEFGRTSLHPLCGATPCFKAAARASVAR